MIIEIPNKLSFLKQYIKSNNYCAKLGGYKDGGYVVDYRAVLASDILVSGGVGSNVRFESDFLDIRNGSTHLILIDPTISIFRMITRGFYHFLKKEQSGFRSFSEVFNFFYLRRKATIVGRYLGVDFNLSDVLNSELIKKSSHIFLKLDIEGSEYDLLDSINLNSTQITGICIEFHDLSSDNNIFKLKYFLEKLDFDIISISINEDTLSVDGYPEILEISLCPSKGTTSGLESVEKYLYLQNSNGLNSELLAFQY
jgi:hypothetical protein